MQQKMVANLFALKEAEGLSRRSSTYYDPECEKIFDIPERVLHSSDAQTFHCFNFKVPGKQANQIKKIV